MLMLHSGHTSLTVTLSTQPFNRFRSHFPGSSLRLHPCTCRFDQHFHYYFFNLVQRSRGSAFSFSSWASSGISFVMTSFLLRSPWSFLYHQSYVGWRVDDISERNTKRRENANWYLFIAYVLGTHRCNQCQPYCWLALLRANRKSLSNNPWAVIYCSGAAPLILCVA